MNKTTSYIIAAVVVIVIVIAGVLAYVYYKPPSTGGGGGTHLDIYASDSPAYGFGNTAGSITSPGPTMTFTAGQTYTVTLHNVGTIPHNWAIVAQKTDGNTNLAFSGAQVGSVSNPIAPGSSGSSTFTAGSAGSYFYICQLDSHVSLGMYGPVTVSP